MARYFKEVFSVEPTPEMASLLRTSLPKNCRVLECAMGTSRGSVVLRVPKIDGARMHALSTVATHDFAFSDIRDIDTVRVQQITIDDLGRETNSRPAFIKIDVEGYEGEVLSGAVSTIESCRPMFLVEIEKRHNSEYKEIFASFDSYGYAAFHFDGAKLVRSSPDQVDASYDYLIETNISGMAGVIESKASGRYVNNFLFLPHK
jgi:FkbM family methyltransferase